MCTLHRPSESVRGQEWSGWKERRGVWVYRQQSDLAASHINVADHQIIEVHRQKSGSEAVHDSRCMRRPLAPRLSMKADYSHHYTQQIPLDYCGGLLLYPLCRHRAPGILPGEKRTTVFYVFTLYMVAIQSLSCIDPFCALS